MNDKKFGSFTLLKLKYRRGDKIIQPFCKIGSPEEIRSPLFNLMSFQKAEKSTAESWRIYWNIMNDEQFGFFKLLKLKYRRGDEIIQLFCKIASPEELTFRVFNLMSFQKAEKGTAERSKRHWNVMNGNEFGSFKLLKLKYRRGDQIIQPFWRIGTPQEIRSPLFNLRKFRKAGKSTAESGTRHWNLMNDKELGSFKLLKLKYRREDQIIQPFWRIGSP